MFTFAHPNNDGSYFNVELKQHNNMEIEVTNSNYEQLLAEGKPLVIDFWAPWCGPCRMVAPIIEELAGEYEGKVNIGKCNVDDNGDVSDAYGIRNIPTVLFFKEGKLVDKQVGSTTKAAYTAKIEALLK
jgi:thioredoxin 1